MLPLLLLVLLCLYHKTIFQAVWCCILRRKEEQKWAACYDMCGPCNALDRKILKPQNENVITSHTTGGHALPNRGLKCIFSQQKIQVIELLSS